jgi:hypothetical protein
MLRKTAQALSALMASTHSASCWTAFDDAGLLTKEKLLPAGLLPGVHQTDLEWAAARRCRDRLWPHGSIPHSKDVNGIRPL